MPLRAPSSNLSIYMVFLGTVKFLKIFKIDWYRNGIWPKPRQGNHSSGFVDLMARAIRLKLGARSSCFHHKIYSAAASKERSQSRKKSGNGESWLHLCSGCSWELITLLPLLLWDTPRISQKSPTLLQGIENSISSGFNFFFSDCRKSRAEVRMTSSIHVLCSFPAPPLLEHLSQWYKRLWHLLGLIRLCKVTYLNFRQDEEQARDFIWERTLPGTPTRTQGYS